MIKNIARQPKPAISVPPNEGPSAVPTADIVPSSPIARPIFSVPSASPASAMVIDIMTAPPSPCARRAASSSHSCGANAQANEAAVNSAMPASSRRRRLRLSPKRPMPMMQVVTASK